MKKSLLASAIVLALANQYAVANTAKSNENLQEIKVVEQEASDLTTTITPNQITRTNPADIKQMLENTIDVNVNELQRTRGGNDGVNIRGLQGNRVATSVDGIPLPESQENKLFTTIAGAFGRGDFVEPSLLRSARVDRSGSASGLSGAIDFQTLEPQDLLKNRAFGGLFSTGYQSVDTSLVGTLGVALQHGDYQGLVVGTQRKGHETKTNGDNSGTGSTRTEANPADYKNGAVLVKNYYQVNEQNRIGLAVEYVHRRTNTDNLSDILTSVTPFVTTSTDSSHSNDQVTRTRLALTHNYTGNDIKVDSKLYFQQSDTENYRVRHQTRTVSGNSTVTERIDNMDNKEKLYGLSTQATQFINSSIPQVLRYGLSTSYHDLTNDIDTTSDTSLSQSSADTKQFRLHAYVEDELQFGDLLVTPQLGLVHYRLNPNADGYNDWVTQYIPNSGVQKQHKTAFLPKMTLAYQVANEFVPYVQYSRGFKAPSAQQLTTSYGRQQYGYAIVGNQNLKPETANNFEAGFKGNNERFNYRVSGFYNFYKNFIDYRYLANTGLANYAYQYQNIAKARIYGVDAEGKWNFYDDFYFTGGLAYSKGKMKDNESGEKNPISTIQPLKLKAGLSYENEFWGASGTITHVRAKADKDIYGSMYNPSTSYNVVDFGLYIRPIKDLTLSASLNNAFDKKYWNWADISYFAGNSRGTNMTANSDSSVAISQANADAYSAPGRNYSINLRYEF
ncbi:MULTISPECIES: TonB-dependent hemoglobin/transferrin/lactoferrin family receptor [unclassified Lonepinella]|uniref:TonB-dependent hemoglobin/transferrin/lactoferrin family receptor n=1 Tax=unclassified Lonepinella TaxID=2642006 RepID=UPI0036DF4BA1